jgi:pimeloyl-ACP methyl ester carboxylesterase
MNDHQEEEQMGTTTHTTGHPVSIAGLAADDYGRIDGRPPLVLLHGMTFDRTTWRDIVSELQRIDPERRVVAIDLPGHGHSPEQPTYELEDVADQLHEVVNEAGLTAPIVVGHSAGALLATIYAARHPSRGVVNIDAPLETEQFANLVRSLADRLGGPEFPVVWQIFYDSFHVELLPPAAQELVRATCQPRQQVVLGYWRQLLEEPAVQSTELIEQTMAALRSSRVPYLHIAGNDLDPSYRRWLDTHLPDAVVELWPHTGHFPHLADPQRFARCLADTARWAAS